jgi:hypothetical protein
MYSNWKVISADLFYRAGAHWRSHAPNSDPEQQQWDTETYNHWLKVLEGESQSPNGERLSGLGVSSCLNFMAYNPSRFDLTTTIKTLLTLN